MTSEYFQPELTALIGVANTPCACRDKRDKCPRCIAAAAINDAGKALRLGLHEAQEKAKRREGTA